MFKSWIQKLEQIQHSAYVTCLYKELRHMNRMKITISFSQTNNRRLKIIHKTSHHGSKGDAFIRVLCNLKDTYAKSACSYAQ